MLGFHASLFVIIYKLLNKGQVAGDLRRHEAHVASIILYTET